MAMRRSSSPSSAPATMALTSSSARTSGSAVDPVHGRAEPPPGGIYHRGRHDAQRPATETGLRGRRLLQFRELMAVLIEKLR